MTTKAKTAASPPKRGIVANDAEAHATKRAARRQPARSQPSAGAKAGTMAGVMALDLQPEAPTPGMAAYFDKCREKIGFVPNVLAAYSHDMAKLEAFAAFYNDLMLAPSGLSKLEREMIAVAVSSRNHCFYCLTAHGAAVRGLSGDPALGEAMVMNYRAADLDERQRAMLDFSVKITVASYEIEEADRDGLRKVGFTDRDIWDIAAVASFFNMSNRMASAVDMRPNPEYHARDR